MQRIWVFVCLEHISSIDAVRSQLHDGRHAVHFQNSPNGLRAFLTAYGEPQDNGARHEKDL